MRHSAHQRSHARKTECDIAGKGGQNTPPDPREPEKAQINIEEADPLYREIRTENSFTDEHGNHVKLKTGAKVEVTVEANPSGIIPKPE